MKRIIFVLIVVIVFITSCSNKDSEGKQENDAVPVGTTKVYPLTGKQVEKGTDDRVVGVMVNNHENARPQSGLSQADIVFEILAEGNITRFLALFQSEKPEVVGPVRSARQYYFELANGYNALYVYHGAAKFVNKMITNLGIDYLNGSEYDNDGHLFKRESFRKAPHNSYLQFEAIAEVANEKGYDMSLGEKTLPFLTTDEIAKLSGESANHIKIMYPGTPEEMVEFYYDENSGKYNRFSNEEMTVELDSGEAIQTDNVLIMETEHEIIDDAGRRSIDITSGGNAYLIQKGKLQRLEWENKDGIIIPTKDGHPVGFVPGKTWINIIPTNPGIEQSVIIANE